MTRAVIEQAPKEHVEARRGASSGRRASQRFIVPAAAAREARAPGLLEARGLARLVPEDEHWRLFPELRPWALYLDIETTGLAEEDPITVVGVGGLRPRVGDGGLRPRAHALVRGRNLTRPAILRALRGARLLVTFNGTTFDLPRLRRAFPDLPWDLPHVDLAVCGRRVGLHGGLKGVERLLGRTRPPALEGLDGAGAARLWRMHEAGVGGARRLLARYCRADVEGLMELAPLIHARMLDVLGEGELPGRLLLRA